MLNGKEVVILLLVGLIKRYGYIKRVIILSHMLILKTKKIEVDLFSYVTKPDVKNVAGVDTLDFAEKG